MIRFIYFYCFLLFNLSFSQNINQLGVSLEDLNARIVNLTDFSSNSVVYINFWALWCQPCRSELKVINNIFEKYKNKNLKIVAVNIDNVKSIAKVKSFVSSQKLDILVLLDPDSKVMKLLNGQSLPFSLLIDSSGEIKKIRTGYLPGDEIEIEKEITELIDESKQR